MIEERVRNEMFGWHDYCEDTSTGRSFHWVTDLGGMSIMAADHNNDDHRLFAGLGSHRPDGEFWIVEIHPARRWPFCYDNNKDIDKFYPITEEGAAACINALMYSALPEVFSSRDE